MRSLAWAAALMIWAKVAPAQDVYVLGEVHDNPKHHQTQVAWIERVKPTAVVFEMLLPQEAAALDAVPRETEALRAATAGFSWPGLDDYLSVFQVSPRIVGAAVHKAEVRSAFGTSAAEVFGSQAGRFGLTRDLPPQQLETRMETQFQAHCAAMPREMMGGMVEAQRLRDAVFARETLAALDQYGAPVVLITGNGHARKDWGVPAVIAMVRPEVQVFALVQTEEGGAPDGGFDALEDAKAPAREDPCAAFN